MRTIEIPHIVPEHTDTRTTYGCDLCDFTDEDERAIIEHEYEKHGAVEEREVEGEKFLRFETEAQFNRWEPYWGRHEATHVKWEGPGWYRSYHEEVPRGCGCGCRDEHYCLTKADHRIKSLRDRAASLNARADRILASLGSVSQDAPLSASSSH